MIRENAQSLGDDESSILLLLFDTLGYKDQQGSNKS